MVKGFLATFSDQSMFIEQTHEWRRYHSAQRKMEQSRREENFLWENPYFLTPTFRKRVTVKLQKTNKAVC